MSFSEFLISGASFQKDIYNFDTFQEPSKPSPDVEKIKKMWDRFSAYTNLLLFSSLGGVIGGSVLVLGSSIPLLGAALLTASLALTIFTLIRSRAAKHQVERWNNYIAPSSDKLAPNRPALDPHAHLREPLAKCLEYYKALILPTENIEAFLNDFFDKDKNPLYNLHLPEDFNKEIPSTHKLYINLLINYGTLKSDFQRAKKSAENTLEIAEMEINSVVDHPIRLYEISLNTKFSLVRGDAKKVEIIKQYVTTYIEERCKAIGQANIDLVKQSLTQYLAQHYEKEKAECLNKFLARVATIVEALKKQNISSFTPSEELRFNVSINWTPPECTYPISIDPIPYDRTKLRGITEAEYKNYLGIKDPAPSPELLSKMQEALTPCITYFDSLTIPTENHEAFLKTFFENNPLNTVVCPEILNKEVSTAKSLYDELKKSYMHLPNGLHHSKQRQLSNLKYAVNDFNSSVEATISSYSSYIETDPTNYNVHREQIKKYLMSYIEASYKSFVTRTLKFIEDSFAKYEQDCVEKDRKAYIAIIFKSVESLIVCLKQKNFSTYIPFPVKKFELSQEWECPQYKFPYIINVKEIPYNSEQLFGVTEAQYKAYLKS